MLSFYPGVNSVGWAGSVGFVVSLAQIGLLKYRNSSDSLIPHAPSSIFVPQSVVSRT
jgi:hypothetical protein